MRRHGARPFFFFPLLLLSLLPSSAWPEPGGYLPELKETAARLGLQDDRYWDILLFYKPAAGGRRSLIDDPKFFLAPDGNRDPGAELSATLDAMFDNSLSPPVRCRFPARFEWLAETLRIDPARLPVPDCPVLDNTLRAINPKSASLIFASGHMNAPASMFGHTFLRLDSAFESPLLSYAVNYAATINPKDSGITYAFKGIFGFYPGYYSILPYYEKVREYASMEQRDLWEYRTNLTEAEVRRMVLHVLEMQGIHADYYFLDENCSYDLLFLLEAARPSVTLTDRHKGFFVTPIETLRSVLTEGLIDNVVFRPSTARTIRYRAAGARDREVDLAKALASGNAAPSTVVDGTLPVEGQARVLDLAAEYTQYLYLKREIPKDSYQGRYLGILSVRSKVGDPPPTSFPLPVPAPPASGHLVSRASLAAGARDGRPFLEAAYRPAYHSLEDPAEGFNVGSQIVFSEAAVRWYPRDDKVRLQRWDLIDIVSLAPRDALFHPVSWKVRTGFATRDFPGSEEALVYELNPGGGFSWKVSSLGIAYVLMETDLAVSGRYDRSFAFGMGGSAGIARQVSDRLGVLARARYVHGVLGDREQGRRFTASMIVPLRLSRNRSLVLEGEYVEGPSVHAGTIRCTLNANF
ncbi:MAG: Lnb N-terminal periplasmic domain-containing protein [Candidatus Deferrimicrobiaceae bacterium]